MTQTNSDDIDEILRDFLTNLKHQGYVSGNPQPGNLPEQEAKAAISKKIVEARIEELKNMPMTYEYSDEGDNFDTELNKWRQDRLKQLRSNDNE